MSSNNEQSLAPKKIHLYANLNPYDLKMALAFYPEETIGDIQFFIEQTFIKYRSKYKIGKIEKKQNNAWLLPQYKINEFLSDQDEINVYPPEFGLTNTKNTKEKLKNFLDINIGFIGKKTKRKGEDDNSSTKEKNKEKLTNKNKINKNKQTKNEQKIKKDLDESSNEDKKDKNDSDDEENDNDNDNNDEDEDNNEDNESDEKNEENDENDDQGDEDDSEDIKI